MARPVYGLFRHPKSGMLWARKDVPTKLRQFVGKTSLQASLRTRDRAEAMVRFHHTMGTFERRIDAARSQLAGQVQMDKNRTIASHHEIPCPCGRGRLYVTFRFEHTEPAR